MYIKEGCLAHGTSPPYRGYSVLRDCPRSISGEEAASQKAGPLLPAPNPPRSDPKPALALWSARAVPAESGSTPVAARGATPHWWTALPDRRVLLHRRDETTSVTWRSRHGYTRAVGELARLRVARRHPVGGWPDKVRLRLRTRREGPPPPLECTPAQSPPFFGGKWVRHFHHAVLAFTFDGTSIAPCAIVLPGVARLVQHLQDHIGADVR